MDLVLGAPSRGDTTVGHDVWLGYQALVLPGVSIGHGAVVAAASVVSADVPDYAIVAGNPARVVRRRNDDADVQRRLADRGGDRACPCDYERHAGRARRHRRRRRVDVNVTAI